MPALPRPALPRPAPAPALLAALLTVWAALPLGAVSGASHMIGPKLAEIVAVLEIPVARP